MLKKRRQNVDKNKALNEVLNAGQKGEKNQA